MRRFFRGVAKLVAVVLTAVMAMVIYYQSELPANFYVVKGNEFQLENLRFLSNVSPVSYDKTNLANQSIGAGQTISLKLFGVVPVKNAHVSVISNQEVTPGGTVFGVKLFTKGVMVIDINQVDTINGAVCPGMLAGLQKGDIILSINSIPITTNEQLAGIISSSGGASLTVEATRDDIPFTCTLTPGCSRLDNSFKGGLWVRDSSAGIGTITYYNKATGVFAGLGHGICDSDTSKIMPLSSGEVCDVKINSVLKGQAGTPGELRGSFTSTKTNGQLVINNQAGIYGYIYLNPNNLDSVSVRLKQDVKIGKATILSTIDDSGPQEYTINIDKVDLNPKTLTKNMTITVTDPRLLATAGGIVQGMSGSPILQDGQLVGAVTHVFVNNPSRGYGIFAENMLQYSNTLSPAA